MTEPDKSDFISSIEEQALKYFKDKIVAESLNNLSLGGADVSKPKEASVAKTYHSEVMPSVREEKGPGELVEKKVRVPRVKKVVPVIAETPVVESVPEVKSKVKSKSFDIDEIKRKIQAQLEKVPIKKVSKKELGDRFVLTGIAGLDELFVSGIPKGATTLVCGGPGSGKTILCLQALFQAASRGEKCFYMTFEESPERLREHMRDFGWDPSSLEESGHLVIQKVSPLDVTRQIDAMLEKIKGELLIDMKPLILPNGFSPDFIAVDSLSAIASAFYGKEETYRLYIEQLFNLFGEIGATSFLISETPDPTQKLTVSGVEEFLADGVIVMYNIRHGNVRESALEILKMRGAGFQKRIVAMQIKPDEGIVVYPEQEIFTSVN